MTALLRELQIAFLAILVLYGPTGALREDIVHLLVVQLDSPYPASAAGNVAKNLVYQVLQLRPDFFGAKRSGRQSNAAIDVEADPSRGDDAGFHIRCRDPANRKSIALVNVRHCQARPHDARQRGNV